MRCQRDGCPGEIRDGYCDDCGMAPRPAATPRTGPSGAGSTGPSGTGVSGSGAPGAGTSGTEVLDGSAALSGAWAPPSIGSAPSSRSGTVASRPRRLGVGLVEVPRVPARDPATAVMAEPHVAEQRRFCGECNEPVGRSRGGVPGRPEGFCRSCGHPFSFVAKLSPGQLIAGQYEVAGCLAHGGLGWIYLARDRKVADRWVVLKGLINTGDEDAMAAALAERRFLAEVEHPNIVKIHNFVEHDGDGYIVMEYVNGQSLRGILEARRAAKGDHPDPLPADQAIAYVLEILPALGYLHDLGLLFCDFKPDNVVQTADSLKLIDLGGVYRMDDRTSPVYGTAGYQAPEIARTGPTVPSDLFTVARTLMVLCTDFRGHRGTYQYTVPPATDVPLFARYHSLHLFLERATASEPDDRFQSADEMAAQLVGVLREVVATSTGTPAPGVSTCFTGEARRAPTRADWRSLPLPLVSPDDPGASLVSSLGAIGPEALLEALEAVPQASVEIDLRRVRALIELGLFDDAAAVLDSLEAAMAGSNQRTNWRVPWHRGLVALAAEDSERASRCFELVNQHLPGELAPRLAMAYAAEASGDPAAATVWYDIVSRIDPGYTQAAFGLARVRLAMDDRPGAIEAYGRIPDSSSANDAARIAQVSALLDGKAAGGAEMPDVRRAATIVDGLGLEGEQRYRLTAAVLEAAFDALHRNGTAPDPSTLVLGHPCTDRGLRLGLEQTYRAVARHAGTDAERIALVDRANLTRPRSWW